MREKNCIHKHKHTHKHCFPKIHFIIILSFKINLSKWHCYCTSRPNIRARFIYGMHAIYPVHLLLSIQFPDNIEGRTQIEQPLFKQFLMLQLVQRTDVSKGSQGHRVRGSPLTSLPLAGSPQPLDADGTRNNPPEGRLGLAVGSISVTSGLALGAPDWLPPPLLAASFVTVVTIVTGGTSG